VIYSELEDTNYTGIGISCGGGLCNVCLAYLSLPALTFSIPKAGDFIDSSAAAVTGDLANRIRLAKEEAFHFNGHFVDKLHQVLTVYYDDVIYSLINAMKDAFSNSRRIPKLNKPLPIVLSGGTASPKGFRERFEKILRQSDFPLQVSEIRFASDPHTATARGALVAAMSES
jgi:tRNA A37 threonylcarbamoyltransferase TsaD